MTLRMSLPSRLHHWPRRLALAGGIFALFIALFGLLGYFWLPGFAKAQLEKLLSEELQRPVSIGAIHVAPYTLEATVENFRAGDTLRFKSLHVDLSAATFARRVPIIEAVSLVEPELTLTRIAAHRLDVSDLLDKWLNKPDDGKPTPEFSVSNIQLKRGRIVWHDTLAKRTETLDDITIDLPAIANVPTAVESYVRPDVSAKLNGSPLTLDGRLRPFAVDRDGRLQVALDNLDLTAALPYLRPYLQLPAEISSLRLATQLAVRFKKVGTGETALGITGELMFSELRATALTGHLRATIDSVHLRGIAVDVPQRQARIGEVVISQPKLDLLREGPDSFVSKKPAPFATRATSTAGTKTRQPAAPSPIESKKAAAATPEKSAWRWAVDHIAVDEGEIGYRDTTIPKSLPLTLASLGIDVGPLTSASSAPIKLQASGKLSRQGHLQLSGEVMTDGNADLAIDLGKLDLVPLQGWVPTDLPVLLSRGELDFKGQLVWHDGTGKVSGNLALNQINLLDKHNADDLLRWRALNFSGLTVTTATAKQTLTANLGDIRLDNFFAKVLLTQNGELNFNQLRKSPTAKTAPAPADASTATQPPIAAAPATPPADATSSPAPKIRVGRIAFANGAIDFTDHFIQPNYATQITQLNGHVGEIKAGTLSPVELHGKVERTAPLDITGQIDPLSKPIGLALHATARSIDLAPLSSYSGRYVGYKIDKGKLSAEVDYKIVDGQLTASNHIFLDQLTFGDKVESKDALSLPITLAVSLLKNSRGEIDLNLPISGSLNDPQFSIGGIIWQVLGNLLSKAVTSPFALLGSLFGGGADLSEVAFPPGQATLTPETASRLEALAKALNDRPALKLEITGTADAASDPAVIRAATLEKKLRGLKQADLAGKGQSVGAAEEVSLMPEERARYLEKLYKKEDLKDKPRNLLGLAKNLPPEEMQTLLLAHFTPNDSDLLTLAETRAQQTQSWLIEQGKIAPERLFLRSAKIIPHEESGKPAESSATPAAAITSAGVTATAPAQGGKVQFSMR